ncbi:PREDICTED: mitochondrial folate transporter/carrier-like [Priapulus caudatus]|uniref:Mitochondrial folate transporter/carrier-like n=1 Tax=Priapulus caudatus TaxID=37621 RepID=A0ABM1EM57_PRICU|nr:PREDICTED: mitochondrial folate transporter/carrier-like [Priapulus caudatus]
MTMSQQPLKIATRKHLSLNFFTNTKYEFLLAGITGGVASTMTVHPLDLIKIRFAVNDNQLDSRPKYQGVMHAVRSIVRADGFLGLYQGVTPNLIGNGAAWGFYFLFYNAIKSSMNQGDTSRPLHASQHMLAACESGVLTLVLTNPIWVTKTRLCLQYESVKLDNTKRYKGMTDCLLKVYKYEGIRGLYKGFLPGLIGVSHGALQFVIYEDMKIVYNKYRERAHNAKLSVIEYLACGASSKMIATSITYPYQVVRARLQDQHATHNGAIDIIRKTWSFEGYRGFYKGLFPSLLRVSPATAITFLVYEEIISLLGAKT